jgi:hypothetical protein
MSDDLFSTDLPEVPDLSDLSDRFRAATDGVGGDGVTMAAVQASVAGLRRRARLRMVVAGAAAAAVVLGGLGVAASSRGDDRAQRIVTAPTTTISDACVNGAEHVEGWFRLTSLQAHLLEAADLLSPADAQALVGQPYQLSDESYEVIARHQSERGFSDEQYNQLHAISGDALQWLIGPNLLTDSQLTLLASGWFPRLEGPQVQALFDHDAALVALPGPYGPIPPPVRFDDGSPATTAPADAITPYGPDTTTSSEAPPVTEPLGTDGARSVRTCESQTADTTTARSGSGD